MYILYKGGGGGEGDKEKRSGVKQVRLTSKYSHNKYELYYLINIT